MLLKVLGGRGGVCGLYPVVSIRGGGVHSGTRLRVILQPGPAYTDPVHVRGQIDLIVGGKGIKGVEPIGFGGVPLIDPHQHSGGLLPLGGAAGVKIQRAIRLRHTGNHAGIIGNGDMPDVPGYVVKG